MTAHLNATIQHRHMKEKIDFAGKMSIFYLYHNAVGSH